MLFRLVMQSGKFGSESLDNELDDTSFQDGMLRRCLSLELTPQVALVCLGGLHGRREEVHKSIVLLSAIFHEETIQLRENSLPRSIDIVEQLLQGSMRNSTQGSPPRVQT